MLAQVKQQVTFSTEIKFCIFNKMSDNFFKSLQPLYLNGVKTGRPLGSLQASVDYKE